MSGKTQLSNNFKKNQLALTQGLEQNRLATTEGFDKMDEVKRWDLMQLPGFEAIEEPENDDENKGATAAPSSLKSKPKLSPFRYNLEKTFDENDLLTIGLMGYPKPNNFYEYNDKDLIDFQEEVKNDIADFSKKNSRIKRNKRFIQGRKRRRKLPFRRTNENLT